MTKILKSKMKGCRSLGMRLSSPAKFLTLRSYKPGQHGPTIISKKTDYGKQLAAKQAFARYYVLREKQVRRAVREASRMKGDRVENFVALLEMRLDAFVYRANFAPTVYAAKQFVSHKYFTVNGRIVNVGSYILKIGDVVELREKCREIPVVKDTMQKMERSIPEYINFDPTKFLGSFIKVPVLADIPFADVMSPTLVIEFYK